MNIENLTGLGDDRVYGYEKRDNTNFIVTSGISDWAIKFKTGCKSEYAIVNIQGKQEKYNWVYQKWCTHLFLFWITCRVEKTLCDT